MGRSEDQNFGPTPVEGQGLGEGSLWRGVTVWRMGHTVRGGLGAGNKHRANRRRGDAGSVGHCVLLI